MLISIIHLYLSGMWVCVDSQTLPIHVSKRNWTTWSNLITILASIVNIIGGTLYDHSMSTRIFIWIMNMIWVMWALKMKRKVSMASIWIYQSSCVELRVSNCSKSGLVRESNHLIPYQSHPWNQGISFILLKQLLPFPCNDVPSIIFPW